MGRTTPMHAILAEEAKARGYRRFRSGWAKDYGETVGTIAVQLVGTTPEKDPHLALRLYLKLDHEPDLRAFLRKIPKEANYTVWTYCIPPEKAPDKKSYLLSIMFTNGFHYFFQERDDLDCENKRKVSSAFHFENDGSLKPRNEALARWLISEHAFRILESATRREELAEHWRREDPPFGIFNPFAGDFLT